MQRLKNLCLSNLNQVVTVCHCAAPPQVGFKHHKDYVGYVWAKQEEADFHRQEHQVIWMRAEFSSEIIFFHV